MTLRETDQVTAEEPFLVYEDEAILAVHKPCRLHSAPLRGGGASLCEWVFARWPETAFDAGRLRPGSGGMDAGGADAGEGGLFHRLDFDTSGLVLFARDPAALEALLEAQEKGLALKEYRAVATLSDRDQPGASPGRGCPSGFDLPAWEDFLDGFRAAGGWAAGEGRPPLEVECRFRPYGPRGARVACLALLPGDPVEGPEDGAGRGARRRRGSPDRPYTSTILSLGLVAEWDGWRGGESSAGAGEGGPLVEARVLIRRGFRHQIRAQLAWLGLPLAGDGLYGGLPAPRLGLMAESLEFPHPRSGKATRIVDPS